MVLKLGIFIGVEFLFIFKGTRKTHVFWYLRLRKSSTFFNFKPASSKLIQQFPHCFHIFFQKNKRFFRCFCVFSVCFLNPQCQKGVFPMRTTCRLKKKTPLAESLSQWKLHLDGFGPPVQCVGGTGITSDVAMKLDQPKKNQSQLVGGWTNPPEKYDRTQNGVKSFPNFWMNIKNVGVATIQPAMGPKGNPWLPGRPWKPTKLDKDCLKCR